MATSLIVASPEMSLGEAARLLKAARVTGAPVLDGNKLVGVLSRNDLLRALAEISPEGDYKAQVAELNAKQVASVMSTGGRSLESTSTWDNPPCVDRNLPRRQKHRFQASHAAPACAGLRTISTDSSMLEAAQIMAEKRLNRLLVREPPRHDAR